MPVHMCGEQGAICELAKATPCDRLVSRVFCLSAGPLQTGTLGRAGATGFTGLPLPCCEELGASTHLGHAWNKAEAWYPRDACLRPSVLVQLDTIGNLLGESLSWDWTGLVDLGVGCLRKVCSR